MRIKLSYYFASEPLARQTPSGLGRWKGHQFVCNDALMRSCDMWVVLDDPVAEETAHVASGRAILLTLEPPLTRSYQPGFLAQFDLVVSCHRKLRHPQVRNEYQGQPWHIGLDKGDAATERHASRAAGGYDGFAAMAMPRKTAALSVICSSSDRLPGHRKRRDFVRLLQGELGDAIDVFGRGVRPVADKAAAILPYRYHIALENSCVADYWTEKLADAYLGWSFPLYWGCPNIGDYFDEASLLRLAPERPDEAVELIRSVMHQELGPERTAKLAAARAMVLDRYNTFDVVRRACESLAPAGARDIVIRPQRHFRPSKARRLATRLTRKLRARFTGEQV